MNVTEAGRVGRAQIPIAPSACCWRRLGPVCGVASKAAAAVEAGADVLFVHPDDLDEATFGARGDLEIVPTRSVGDALKWLTARR